MKGRIGGKRKFWSAESFGLTANSTAFKRSLLTTAFRLGVSVCALLVVLASVSHAHSATKTLRLGILEPGGPTNGCNDGVRQGLRALGYIEKQNLIIEARHADFKPDRLQQFAKELAKLNPDALWTHGAVRALKQATSTTPIILGVSRNLVELGLVASLARPGGNITGMDLRDGEILGKRLELLKEAIPKSSRVGVLADPSDPGHAAIPKNIEREAHALQIQLHRMEASRPEDFDGVFVALLRVQADSLILPESPVFSQNRQRIFKSAITKRVPTAAGGSHFAEAGT